MSVLLNFSFVRILKKLFFQLKLFDFITCIYIFLYLSITFLLGPMLWLLFDYVIPLGSDYLLLYLSFSFLTVGLAFLFLHLFFESRLIVQSIYFTRAFFSLYFQLLLKCSHPNFLKQRCSKFFDLISVFPKKVFYFFLYLGILFLLMFILFLIYFPLFIVFFGFFIFCISLLYFRLYKGPRFIFVPSFMKRVIFGFRDMLSFALRPVLLQHVFQQIKQAIPWFEHLRHYLFSRLCSEVLIVPLTIVILKIALLFSGHIHTQGFLLYLYIVSILFGFFLVQWLQLCFYFMDLFAFSSYFAALKPMDMTHRHDLDFRGEFKCDALFYKVEEAPAYVFEVLNFHLSFGDCLLIHAKDTTCFSFLIDVFACRRRFSQGHLVLNNQDFSVLESDDLLSNVFSFDAHNTFLNTSIESHLNPLGIYDEDSLWQALTCVGLFDQIQVMPLKLKTPIDHAKDVLHASALSLLLLAPVFLRTYQLILIDDRYLPFDSTIRNYIYDSLFSLGVTLIFFTADPYSYDIYDHVMLLNKEGRVFKSQFMSKSDFLNYSGRI
eukprot:COSAG01_NODE_412_length_17370_cov_26.910196_4_plen_547_part_00